MKFTLFLGCNIPARVQQYDMASRAILDRLGVEIADNDAFKCCGYPMRNTDFKAYVLSSARNLALAEKQNLGIVTLCKCCFGSLKKANHLLKEDTSLNNEINAVLAKEGLEYNGGTAVTHLLSVLYNDLGLSAIKEKVTRPFNDLNIATHYGCHALRPSDIMQFDNPIAPVLFDELVEATGAKSIDWSLKLECCGAPLLGANDELSMDLADKKLADGKQSGADYLCSACPWCQLQFDQIQQAMCDQRGTNHQLPSIVYPQLLGLVMDIDRETLGINMNRIDISGLEGHLLQE